ncbi:DUF3551 domain-containing protein [Bradyrhizobium sp. 2TAF24]|uniref:DUF3551 domain-containing protein n=1 Tax=Bradyrhizobium sp. 2TAF24 TaxID=3233011 RepID=UPI003F9231EF
MAIISSAAPLGSAARAGEHAWCIVDDIDTRCDYATRQQCMATGSGIGASCVQNPRVFVEVPSRAAYAKYR